MITQTKKENLGKLKLEYEQLRGTHNDLLKMIAESELPEMVYNAFLKIGTLMSKKPSIFVLC